jgi:hypothetical protein
LRCFQSTATFYPQEAHLSIVLNRGQGILGGTFGRCDPGTVTTGISPVLSAMSRHLSSGNGFPMAVLRRAR